MFMVNSDGVAWWVPDPVTEPDPIITESLDSVEHLPEAGDAYKAGGDR